MNESVEQLPKGVRRTPAGKFEVIFHHPSLSGGRASRCFDDVATACRYRENRLAELRAGIKLPELTRAPSKGIHLSVVIRDYLNSDTAKVAPSDRPTVIRLQNTLTGTLKDVTTTWVDEWVRSLKRVDKVAPSTIRKRCESLARCIDWWSRKEYPTGGAPTNPLRTLPIGYSTYHADDVKPGQPLIEDEHRDRRLHAGEYEHLEEIINGKVLGGKPNRWGDVNRADFLMLFRLIVHTGLRLREAYSLRKSDIKFVLRTIHIRQSKTGSKRDVPTSRKLEGWLKAHIEASPVPMQKDDLIFPFWSGSTEGNVLRDTTILMSKRFRKLFAYAGCEDLVEHDLRHEATCRWMELQNSQGGWLYRPEEVRRITGHKSVQIFERYLSLRGSDLAERLD